MKILALCGSIRKESSHWSLIKACAKIEHTWTIFDLSDLPYFVPELQFSEDAPEAVKHLRAVAGASDLIFISTPEYAHGIPGILKNGLEWLFSEETMKKPVAVVIGSGQGEFVKEHLLEVLKTMDFEVSEKSFLHLKGLRTRIDDEGRFLDSETKAEVEHFLKEVTGAAI